MTLKCGSLKVMEKQYTFILRIKRQKDQKLKKVTTYYSDHLSDWNISEKRQGVKETLVMPTGNN